MAAIAQYLTFRIGSDDYALNVLKVLEIRAWGQVRPLPRYPEYIRGVIAFRGDIVPVVDLRLRFGAKEAEYHRETVIIIVAVSHEGQQLDVGLVVDEVSSVADIDENRIRPAPELEDTDSRFLQGIARDGERLIAVIDVDHVLDSRALQLLEHTRASDTDTGPEE